MYKYLKIIIYFQGFILNHISAQNGDVQLAIQQGHSNDITHIAVSGKSENFATYGRDKKIIIWDNRTGSQIAFQYITIPVSGLRFDNNPNFLYIQSAADNSIVKVNISDMSMSYAFFQADIIFRTQNMAVGPSGKALIDGAKIKLINNASGNVKKTKTSDYFDQPFHSIIYSPLNNSFYVACEDGYVYVFNEELKLTKQLKGHNSGVNDLCISADSQHLYSVSSDRSIIKWRISTETLESRHTGKNFSLYGLSLNRAGNQILFGDEIGYLKNINIKNTKLEINGDRKYLYPLTQTHQFNDSEYLYAGESNRLFLKTHTKAQTFKNIRISNKTISHHVFTRLFGFYQPTYSNFIHVDVSPSAHLVATSNEMYTRNPPYIRISDISNPNKIRKSPKLFLIGHKESSVIFFLNDSTLVSSDQEKSLVVWRVVNHNVRNIAFKKIELPVSLKSIARVNDHQIAGYNANGLFVYDLYNHSLLFQPINNISAVFYLSQGQFAFSTQLNTFHSVRCTSDSMHVEDAFKGHQDAITGVCYEPIRNLYFSTSLDGTIMVWDGRTHSLKITIVPIGYSDYVCVTPDNYYMLSGKNVQSFGFKMGNQYFLPEQFDPFYNRPDIVLERLGYAQKELIDAYRKAYYKRIHKMGFSEKMLSADFHLPETEIKNIQGIPANTSLDSIKLDLRFRDNKYVLDRYNIWVNNVPLYGTKGRSLIELKTNEYNNTQWIHLAPGKNKIQVSCMNESGAESYKSTVPVYCQKLETDVPPKVYFIGIGLNKYHETGHELKYSVKDIRDLSKVLRKRYGEAITIDTLFDKQVNRKNILDLKSKLLKTNINDKVIIAFSGHGLLDTNYNYFLSTYGVNFNQPEINGLPYEDLEWLLDSIPARRKLLLIDACHSGELDKEEMQRDTQMIADNEGEDKKGSKVSQVKMRNESLGLKNSFQLMQELFVNLSKGCGAIIISAAGGDESALEGDKFKNGYFTYAILELLKQEEVVSINQLREYVFKEVAKLSAGRQQPTSRYENMDVDWNIVE